MKLTFAQFEKAAIILENSIDTISDDVLLENGFTREELEKINEGILGDIIGGLFGKIKEKVLRAIPGNLLKKIDAVLTEYKDVQLSIYDKTKRERDKIYKANLDDKESPRNKELVNRAEKAIQAIEEASKSKKDAIYGKLQMLTKDKSDIVKNYAQMQLLQIQEDVATKKLDDAEKYASEEELDKLEKEVNDLKKKKEQEKKAIEDAKVKEKEEEDKKANDPANAKVGQVWLRHDAKKHEQEAEIVDLEKNHQGEKLEDGMVLVKTKNTPNGFVVNKKSLEKLIKNV